MATLDGILQVNDISEFLLCTAFPFPHSLARSLLIERSFSYEYFLHVTWLHVYYYGDLSRPLETSAERERELPSIARKILISSCFSLLPATYFDYLSV
jgi:hypothetical protein